MLSLSVGSGLGLPRPQFELSFTSGGGIYNLFQSWSRLAVSVGLCSH